MELSSINFWAILAGTFTCLVAGYFWYGPLFGSTLENRQQGKQDGKSMIWLSMRAGPATILTFIVGLVIAALLPAHSGWLDGLLLGAILGLGLAAASIGLNYLYTGRSLTRFLIDGAYLVLVFLIFGMIIGAWHV